MPSTSTNGAIITDKEARRMRVVAAELLHTIDKKTGKSRQEMLLTRAFDALEKALNKENPTQWAVDTALKLTIGNLEDFARANDMVENAVADEYTVQLRRTTKETVDEVLIPSVKSQQSESRCEDYPELSNQKQSE